MVRLDSRAILFSLALLPFALTLACNKPEQEEEEAEIEVKGKITLLTEGDIVLSGNGES